MKTKIVIDLDYMNGQHVKMLIHDICANIRDLPGITRWDIRTVDGQWPKEK